MSKMKSGWTKSSERENRRKMRRSHRTTEGETRWRGGEAAERKWRIWKTRSNRMETKGGGGGEAGSRRSTEEEVERKQEVTESYRFLAMSSASFFPSDDTKSNLSFIFCSGDHSLSVTNQFIINQYCLQLNKHQLMQQTRARHSVCLTLLQNHSDPVLAVCTSTGSLLTASANRKC